MSRPVSVAIPCLDDRDLLERSLPPLAAELARRRGADEVLVVDDTGQDRLARWLGERFPGVRVLARAQNGGFARALRDGFEAARHELVFAMNPDVVVRPGFLEPLVACLEQADVQAAVPRVLLRGREDAVESLVRMDLERGEARVLQPGLAEGDPSAPRAALPDAPVPVPFAIGGTSLFRRAAFLERGGFDPAFEPFYWEDVDLGWTLWRAGGRVLYQPASVVEHHHRGTIGRVVPEALVRAAIEKNRLLFLWKHLDGEERLLEHLAWLQRFAIDAWMGERREELVWLALALEQADQALAARAARPAGPGFGELCRRTSPLPSL